MAGIVAIAGTVLPQILAFSIPDNPAQRFALGCAAISLLISLLTGAVVVALRGRQQPGAMVTVGHVAALLSGVAAAIVQAIVLVMRVVYVCVDLTNGVPWRDVRAYGFGTGGLWTVGLLVAACAVSWRSTRDGRLAACQFWTAVLFVAWTGLLSPVLHRNTSGGYERSETTLITFAALCALLLVASLWSLRFGDEGSSKAGEDEADESPEESQAWPGFRASCTALAVLLTVLTCYHLLVRPDGDRFRGACGAGMFHACTQAVESRYGRRRNGLGIVGFVRAGDGGGSVTSGSTFGPLPDGVQRHDGGSGDGDRSVDVDRRRRGRANRSGNGFGHDTAIGLAREAVFVYLRGVGTDRRCDDDAVA